MESLQLFLDRSGPGSEAESVWLKNIFTFIYHHLRPGTCSPAPSADDKPLSGVRCDHSVYRLSLRVLEKIKEKLCVSHGLPVSYRPMSVSELVSQQHLACVSNMSWSTNQQRAWIKEAELLLPGQQALPRVKLLLIGWLTEGRGGDWRLTDSSSSVRCEVWGGASLICEVIIGQSVDVALSPSFTYPAVKHICSMKPEEELVCLEEHLDTGDIQVDTPEHLRCDAATETHL